MHNLDINLKNISKIEGHTHLDIKVRDNKVIECKLKISENKKFFTQAITGKNFNQVPQLMSRICGTCSSAHILCSIEAIEKAFKLKSSPQTYILRNLLANAGHLRDHAMHLYFFCLPDIFHKDSVLDFTGDLHQYVHDGLAVKEAGNFLSTIIGGRAVHPPNAVVGGFTQIPSPENVEEAKQKLINIRPKLINLIKIFFNNKKSFKRKTNYVALVNNDYNFLEGEIKTANKTLIPEEKFGEHLTSVVLPYSTATAFVWESKEYMVGALARLNLNKQNLHPNTLRDTKLYLAAFPSDCIFNNNLAQAIECLHIVDKSLELLKTKFKLEKPVQPKLPVHTTTGVGVVEAPRGTLYYRLDINPKGAITFADLCIPTQQNIIHLEKDIASYVEQLLRQNKNQQEISMEAEQVIRAYDPCMSCATHFLKINWI